MAHKLLILAFILSAANAFAQHNPEAPGQKMPPMHPMPHVERDTEFTTIGAPLPDFMFKTIKGKVYSRDDFKNNANLFVMIFDPGCHHCQEETKMIEESIGLFKKSKIVLITNENFGIRLPDFIKDEQTDRYHQFTIGIDSTGIMKKIFLYTQLPQINIYDKSRKLIKIFKGTTPIDSLRQYIQ